MSSYLRYLPPESQLVRELAGEAADWTVDTYLLAAIFDAMNLRLWQAAGRKGTPKPKPAHRPYQSTRGGHRRSTLDPEQRGAKLLEFTERRQRELAGGD